MKLHHILGLNSRSQNYSYPYNTPQGRKIARSKLLTKRILQRPGIPIPQIYAKFRNPRDVLEFNWSGLPESFALKPSKGLGGEGIIVIKKKSKDGVSWITTQRKKVITDDLKLHSLDILEGAYSVGNIPDYAYIEEYVGRHKRFRKYAYRGTPDIRIIVFNKIPVLAMLRLPTKESGGRANLHQGALGVGIDISTGITTKAIWHADPIKYKPGTKRKLNGIKIPNWTRILEIAVQCQMVSFLGYVGVDIVLHPEKGPMVLEINSQPGLQIQLANMTGLRKRLERVDELEVRDAQHGVNIAKAIFAGRFSDRVSAEEGIKILSIWEEIKIVAATSKKVKVFAKVDTGAWRTSIDTGLAKELGLLETKNVLWTRKIRTAVGREERPVINMSYYIAGRRVDTIASVSNRKHLRVPVIIGRRDLLGFLVSPSQKGEKLSWVPPMWKGEVK
jgi:alpha-L-glutamate ligase-like protein